MNTLQGMDRYRKEVVGLGQSYLYYNIICIRRTDILIRSIVN